MGEPNRCSLNYNSGGIGLTWSVKYEAELSSVESARPVSTAALLTGWGGKIKVQTGPGRRSLLTWSTTPPGCNPKLWRGRKSHLRSWKCAHRLQRSGCRHHFL